jgi:hypothetical protein
VKPEKSDKKKGARLENEVTVFSVCYLKNGIADFSVCWLLRELMYVSYIKVMRS